MTTTTTTLRGTPRGTPLLHGDHDLCLVHLALLDEEQIEAARLGKLPSKPGDILFVEVDLPAGIPPLPSRLWGPAAGDPPVDDADVVLALRFGRDWPSRTLPTHGARPWRKLIAIGGIGRRGDFVWYTAYGGPCVAPREALDPSLADDPEALAESVAFWRVHALGTAP
jgi:hypothetical protein